MCFEKRERQKYAGWRKAVLVCTREQYMGLQKTYKDMRRNMRFAGSYYPVSLQDVFEKMWPYSGSAWFVTGATAKASER